MRLTKRLLILLISLSSTGCKMYPTIKTDVADVPICRVLHTKTETKDVPNIGKVSIQRPNPKCMKEIGEPFCGYCVWTVSDKFQYVGNEWNHLLQLGKKKKTINTVIEEAGIIPAESTAAIKASVIIICKNTGACSQEVDRWRVKLDSLDSVGDAFP